MKEKLNIIVSELLKNKELIQQEIDACLFEFDYLGAHYHSIALKNINTKIQTFQSLLNPNYDKITHLEWRLKRYKTILEEDNHENLISYYTSEANHLETNSLELKSKNSEFRNQTFTLKQNLQELIKNKLFNIELILKKDSSKSIYFIKNNADLRILINENCFKFLTIGDDYKNELKDLHFNKFDEDYILDIVTFNTSKIDHVLEIISRIVFDIFHFKTLDNPMILKCN